MTCHGAMLDASNILVPVDFSRGSQAALHQARHLAALTHAQVQCLHLVPPALSYIREVVFPFAALGSEELALLTHIRRNAETRLRHYLEVGEGDKATRPDIEVVLGNEERAMGEQLMERVAELESDLVFIGSSGESGELPGHHGTVAERMVTQSTRPVFVSRTSEQRRTIKRVAVALDLSPSSAAVYTKALEAALVYEASLHVLVVAADPRNQDIGGIVGAVVKVEPNAVQKRANRDVRKKLARIRDEVQIPFPWHDKLKLLRKDEHDRILFGDPAEQLVHDVVEHNIDLLVVGRQGHRRTALPMRLGRTARAVVGYAPCHLLVVPPQVGSPMASI
ncbi:MAG: universal stress protein [Myxococcota bacterium]